MGISHEAAWPTADNPRHLLRLSRVRPSGRKYALLACAVVRHLVPGTRGDPGGRVLDAIERFAVAQPKKGVQTHIWRQVVRPGVPELPDRLPRRGAELWIAIFEDRLGPLSTVCGADINVLFDFAFRLIESNARTDAADEVRKLTNRISPFVGPKSPPRMTVEELRDEIVSRLPAERQAEVRARWAGVTDSHAAWNAALPLFNYRFTTRMAEANTRACDLLREVFADPFRPAVIEPGWLVCNHGAARHIAEQIAASGNFADLPILADALEDAGCRDEELLRHCREGHLHVPGCWALDAVLGRG